MISDTRDGNDTKTQMKYDYRNLLIEFRNIKQGGPGVEGGAKYLV